MEEEVLTPSQLDLLTYRSPERQNTLDYHLPGSRFPPVDIHICEPPKVDLGTLDVLPLELLQQVIPQLDLSSLSAFRRVNRRAVQVVDSTPQYKAIAKHARNVLRAILSVGTGQWITCEAVYEALCTAECERCGDFAGYLYIITCRRVCFVCLDDSKVDTYQPLQRAQATRRFGLDRITMNALPRMRSIPGRYSSFYKKGSTPLVLIDFESAYNAGIARHGSISAMESYVDRMETQKRNNALKRKAAKGVRTTRPPQIRVYMYAWRQLLRSMAIVRMPCLDRATQQLEWGFYCKGCSRSWSKPFHCERLFTWTSFHEHLTQCGRIENGKHQRKISLIT